MKDALIFIQHIIENVGNIESFSKDITKEEFSKDILRQNAIIRSIEVIGEAAKNLPSDFKKKHQTIPWKDIAGMRDKLIHNYFGVDLKIVWKVIKEDLPKLKKDIQGVLDKE